MPRFEQFRDDLAELLRHLHDPDCQPPNGLYTVLGHDPAGGVSALQTDVIRTIEGLQRSLSPSSTERTRRDTTVLRDRYLLRLTQEEAAERANMSVRNVRRAQREATHMLARLFWEHYAARAASQQAPVSYGHTGPGEADEADWRRQVRQELSSLQAGAPSSVADVAQAIAYAVQLEAALLADRGLTLSVGRQAPGAVAAVHPAVLRQVLIVAIAQLSRCLSAGPFVVETEAGPQSPTCLSMTLRGRADCAASTPDDGVLREIVALAGGSIEWTVGCGEARLCISIPTANQLTVLAIDDNPDMVHFYQRCTAGSRYRVVAAEQGRRTIEAIAEARPDAIVLDIILPDADGWHLLSQLRRHPATRAVPVILCSIVREEDLAQALGAAIYLPKPVGHRQFMAALDEAVSRAPAAGPTS